jgi:hypothetical protein
MFELQHSATNIPITAPSAHGPFEDFCVTRNPFVRYRKYRSTIDTLTTNRSLSASCMPSRCQKINLRNTKTSSNWLLPMKMKSGALCSNLLSLLIYEPYHGTTGFAETHPILALLPQGMIDLFEVNNQCSCLSHSAQQLLVHA